MEQKGQTGKTIKSPQTARQQHCEFRKRWAHSRCCTTAHRQLGRGGGSAGPWQSDTQLQAQRTSGAISGSSIKMIMSS